MDSALARAAEAARLRRLDDPERDRRRLTRTVKVGNPDGTDEERAAEVERLFRAIRPNPDQGQLAAMRRAFEAIRQEK